jgi:hypothetical protein
MRERKRGQEGEEYNKERRSITKDKRKELREIKQKVEQGNNESKQKKYEDREK